MDQIENHSSEQTQGQNDPEMQPKKQKKNWLGRILGGDVLQSRGVVRQIPLILLLCAYGLILVWNRYSIEDLSRQKQAKQDELNYLGQKQIELQKRYQETVKISQIAELLDSTGIGITAGPPFELKIDN